MTIKKHATALMCVVGLLAVSFLAACGGGGDQGRDPILGQAAANLVSVAVTPANATVLTAETRQFTATATYADGSSRDVTAESAWLSASPGIAGVSPAKGLATGISSGSAAISATFSSKSGAATLVVTTPLPPPPPVVTLLSITVTPSTATIAPGVTQQFVAIGNYSDKSTAIITNSVSWTSGTTANGTIVASGMATGVAAGSTTISASSGGQIGGAVLNVTVPPVIPVTPPVTPPLVPPVVPPVVGPIEPPGVPQVPTVPPVVPPTAGISLGRAASFAVLAGTSITNNSGGTTLVTGDVGAPSQTTAPVQAAGYANYSSGQILAGALEDLQIAVTSANGQTCTVNSASGVDLGGLVLTPGVYCYAGAISITGTFTLNGPGVYIFRTASTLNSTANAVVALSGGASASSVYWIPAGPTTLGANGVFKGSILSQSAAITVGDNTTLLSGRTLSGAAVTLRNNQISK
ncbi:ice-binding family protein [Massilia sp. CCM 8734]|uniref:ice-binding family protein n=1 Tax=Massilia sp. CCM 8734 TaxID=2609283 RepID=UPI0014234996|nr:ice-binding family protein [Massilia sp. CCM 8734]NHZ97341.1 DUF3494 domain-containing protein [Massilia sp. CCM 8734]